jgi:hypothetical protein
MCPYDTYALCNASSHVYSIHILNPCIYQFHVVNIYKKKYEFKHRQLQHKNVKVKCPSVSFALWACNSYSGNVL